MRYSDWLETLSETQFKYPTARVDIAGLIAQRHIAILVADIDNIVQDIFNPEGNAASFQQRHGLYDAGLLVHVDEQKCADDGNVAKPQVIATGKASAVGAGVAFVCSLQPEAKTLVEQAARKFDFMPRYTPIAAGG